MSIYLIGCNCSYGNMECLCEELEKIEYTGCGTAIVHYNKEFIIFVR